MAPLLSLLSWSTLAVLFASLPTSPVFALSLNIHEARMSPNHGELARRMSEHRRVKRCKPRSSVPSAPAPTSSDAPKPTSSQPAAPAPPPPKSSSPSKPKPKPSPPPPSGPAGNAYALCPGKKMLAWGAESDFLTDQWANLAKLIYTWGPTTTSDVEKFGVKACSMLWGEKDVEDFKNKVLNSDSKVDCVLGMNEPEIPSQGNMDPHRAADLWVENIVPLKQKKGSVLVTPAVTSDTPTNTKWYDTFFAACADRTGSKTCQADAMALHYYDTSAQGFKDFLKMMHDKYNLPILVTEFADHSFNGQAQSGMDQIWDFAGQMKTFFDETDYIACYAPFGAILENDLPDINKLNAIMGNNHLPTDLGYFYYN